MSSRVVVEADGGSRGNPGPAGAGALVREPGGRVLAERSRWLGTATNNVAEYEGLLLGLRAAAELGATEVDVRMDSKLVIEQMTGRWRVKHANLQPLASEATSLLGSFAEVRFQWVPRAENAHADRLANEAMDQRTERDSIEKPVAGDRAQPAAWTGATGAPTRLLLLRHGQTEMSVDRRYSGRGDVPLTELGERQVLAAGRRLAEMDGLISEGGTLPVVSSPLGRAKQTAQAVAEATGGELTLHDGLLETDFGDWEGLTFLEAAEKYPDLHKQWLGDPTVEPPGGEALETVFERVRETCGELVRTYAGQTVVLVSHVTPIKAVLRLGLDVGPALFYRLHLDLASLSIVEFYPDGNASVRLVNDISHLR